MIDPLYVVADKIGHLQAIAEDQGGELTDEQFAELERGLETLEAKADIYGSLIVNTEAADAVCRGHIAAYQAEIDRLNKAMAVRENLVKRLKRRMLDLLRLAMLPNIRTPRFYFFRKKNAPGLVVPADVDLDKLPAEFVRVKTEKSLDKVKMLEAAKAGGKLPEGFAVQQTEGVQFK